MVELVPGEVRYKLLLANVELSDGNYEISRQILKSVVNKDPLNMHASLMIVELEDRDGNFSKALEMVKELQLTHKKKIEPYMQEAKLYFNASKYNDVNEVYVRASELFPNNIWALKRSELIAIQKGKNPETPLLEWLHDNPNDKKVLNVLAEIYLQQKNLSLAAKTYEKNYRD